MAQGQTLSPAAPARVWTPSFVILCGAVALAYAHEGLLNPTIPLYVQALTGSTAVVGLVLGLFSLVSFAIRPLIGHLADVANPRLVLGLGVAGLALCDVGLLLPIFAAVCLLSAFRGLSWAATNTGSNTILAHLAPPQRRAESASYYSLFQSTAIALVPSAALLILRGSGNDGYGRVFWVAAACAAAAALLVRAIPVGNRTAPAASGAASLPRRRLQWSQLFDRAVLLPASLLAIVNLTYPAGSAFMPLYIQSSGIDLGILFWYYAARASGVVVAQAGLGRLFDGMGRGPASVLGMATSVVGFAFLLVPGNVVTLILGGIATAVGQSITVANTTALAIDRSNPQRIGSAMASFTLAFQIGQGSGAAASGFIVDLAGYRAMYLTMIGALVAAMTLLLVRWKSLSFDLNGGSQP